MMETGADDRPQRKPGDAPMSLPNWIRDWLAGQALEGILSNDALMDACDVVSTAEKRPLPEQVAKTAYMYADAMLEARQK